MNRAWYQQIALYLDWPGDTRYDALLAIRRKLVVLSSTLVTSIPCSHGYQVKNERVLGTIAPQTFQRSHEILGGLINRFS